MSMPVGPSENLWGGWWLIFGRQMEVDLLCSVPSSGQLCCQGVQDAEQRYHDSSSALSGHCVTLLLLVNPIYWQLIYNKH